MQYLSANQSPYVIQREGELRSALDTVVQRSLHVQDFVHTLQFTLMYYEAIDCAACSSCC